MQSDEARHRLLLIARERLCNRPGGYEKFLNALATTAVGEALMLRAQTLPFAWGAAELMGSDSATKLITEHLTAAVDWWAESQPATKAAAPLSTPRELEGLLITKRHNDFDEAVRLIRDVHSKADLVAADDAAESVQASDKAFAIPDTPTARRANQKTKKVIAGTPNWWSVAGLHMAAVLRAGQFSTAKQLNAALTKDAGQPSSPFDKGQGEHRGTLYVRDLHRPLALKTIQNNWSRLKQAADTL